MDYIKGIPREQAHLFTDCLDNIIDSDNEVHIIDVFVESINIEEFGYESKLNYEVDRTVRSKNCIAMQF